MIEYSGMSFALFFLAEYMNMILISAMSSVMFLGGWLSPFPASIPFLGAPSFIWWFLKVAFMLFFFLWARATFPRYRYDQLMRLAGKSSSRLPWSGSCWSAPGCRLRSRSGSKK